MRLISLEIRNFRCFQHFKQEFHPGFVGVFGPNGAGKTTMVNSIYSVLTNDFSRFDGVIANMIREGTSAKAHSFIKLVAEHDGTPFTVVRSFQPAHYHLKIGDEKLLTKTADILIRLEEFLGVGKVILDNYVFINQWDIFGFLKLAPAERARTFQYLCGTLRAEELWKTLGIRIARMQEDNPPIDDNSDELRLAVRETRKQFRAKKAERNQLKAKLLSSEQVKELEGQVKKGRRLQSLKEQVASHEELVAKAKDALTRSYAARETASALHERLVSGLRDLRPAAEAAEEARAAWKAYERYVSTKTGLQQEHQAAQTARKQLESARPVKPDGFDEQADWRQQLADATRDLKTADAVVKTFTQKGVTACPTCGTSVKSLEGYLKECREKKLLLPGKIRDVANQLDRIRHYADAIAEHNSMLSRLIGREETVAESLANIVPIPEPELPKEKIEETLTVYRKLQSSETEQAQTLNTARAHAKSSEGWHQNRVDEMSELLQQIETLEEAAVDWEKAEKKLAAHTNRKAEYEALRLLTGNYKTALLERKAVLQKLTDRIAARRKLQVLIEHLEAIRSVVHAHALPRVVAQTNLEGMEDIFNAVLERFGNPFAVSAREDLSLDVQFPGQSPRRAESLSGGQLVILALAYHRAVCEVFASRIGLQSLDEPTVGLDDKNIDFLHDCLRHFTADAQNRGTQVLMISHSARLRSAFRQVIDIKPEDGVDEA